MAPAAGRPLPPKTGDVGRGCGDASRALLMSAAIYAATLGEQSGAHRARGGGKGTSGGKKQPQGKWVKKGELKKEESKSEQTRLS